MTSSPLDYPVWHSLTTDHEHFALGGTLARRYSPEVNFFAAARNESPQALEALASLVSPGQPVFLLQKPKITTPEGMTIAKQATGVQMVCNAVELLPSLKAADEEEIQTLDDAAAPEMLALAHLTEPGPFAARTHEMGRFIGIRRDGRLAAMAGTRLAFPGHREVSAVCVHPDFRGQGLARRLSIAVSRQLFANGETPFLHAWSTNFAAITLYETIGFRHLGDVNVAVLENRQS